MKNKLLKLSRIIFFTVLLSSCANHPIIKNNIDTVDLVDAYKLKGEVLLSQIAEKIEYIPLEAIPNYIIDQPYTIAANDSNLIIIAFRKILVFKRSTGRFKCEISSYGRGPNEYLFTIANSGYYEPDDMIFAGKDLANLIMGFSSDGTLKKIIKRPNNVDEGYFIVSIWPFRVNSYIGYSINYSGINPYKIEEFDSTGTVFNRYPNYNRFDKNKYPKDTRSLMPVCFFNYLDSIRFIEPLTDSVFTVSENKLFPRYKIKMGPFAPPYYLQGTNYFMDYEHLKYFWLSTFQESSRFLFFTTVTNFYSHLCFYDKELKRTYVCDINRDKESYKFITRPPRYYNKIRTIGFKNNIDGFLPVGTGFGELYINRKNEMTTYILASDVERWFRNNPEEAKNLPQNLKKYSTTKATDNIIVMIVKLKTK
jgi:hypothetical protein